MLLSPSDVEKIAQLARLAVNPNEFGHYADQLSKILQFVEQMAAIDTSQVEPMAHPLNQTQRLRADEVTETDLRSLFQEGAPLCEAGLYLVPKVLE